MFNNNFKNQDAGLVDAIKTIMKESNRRSEIERKLNEELGITSRNALPHEHQKEYDSIIEKRVSGNKDDSSSSAFINEANVSSRDQEAMDAVGMDAFADEKGNVRWNNKGFQKPPRPKTPKTKKVTANEAKLEAIQEDGPGAKWRRGPEGKTWNIDPDHPDQIGKIPVDPRARYWGDVLDWRKKMQDAFNSGNLPHKERQKHLADMIRRNLGQGGLGPPPDAVLPEELEAIQEEIVRNLLNKVNYINEQYGEDAVQHFYDNLSEEEKNLLDLYIDENE